MPHFHYKDLYQIHSEFVWNRQDDASSAHQIPINPRFGNETSWWSVGLLQGAYRVWLVLFFMLSPALAVPLLLGFGTLRDRSAWTLAIACLLVLFSHFAVDRFFPHYAAPLVAPMWILALMVLRSLHEMKWRQRPVGAGFGIVASLVIVISFLAQAPAFRPDEGSPSRNLEQVRALLEAKSGQQLVLIQPGPRFNLNEADLWGTDVLWAFDYGVESNRELVELFPEHTRWRLDLYGSSVEVRPWVED